MLNPLRQKLLPFVFLPSLLLSPCAMGSSRAESGLVSLQAASSERPGSGGPAPELAKKASAPKEKKKQPEDPDLEIRDIRVESKKGVKDTVHIFANRLFTPSVSALEGDRPRFVIDILKATRVDVKHKLIHVGGDFIEQIRLRHDRGTGTFRVVLDLHPSKNYKVNQMFFEAENIYAIEVEEERNP